MTICIALVCQGTTGPRILTCMDSRLDETYYSTDRANKFDCIGDSWFALLSGAWAMANELSRFISERTKQSPPTTRGEFFSVVRQATVDFDSSVFYDATVQVELIIGGFIGEDPMLMYTGYNLGTPSTTLSGDTAVTGSGANIASSILKIRQYGSHIREKEAVYLAYEAKNIARMLPA
jgi:hypothetical protein